jgi:predicted DnaQ family exonuclease/DinG family helicase
MSESVPNQLPSDLLEALNLSSFVALDLETTGLDPAFERIIEAGAVRFRDGVEIETFESLIACPVSLSPFIVELTGITDAMLENQPLEETMLQNLLDFIGDDVIVGQNVNFDLSFLRVALQRNGAEEKLHQHAIDTALLARVFLPTLPSRGLSSLGRFFNLDVAEAHRALADARRCGEVLCRLLSFFTRVDIKTVDLLRRLSEGLYHPSAWIFTEWANYLMQAPSVESGFQPHKLPHLRENVLGKLPHAGSLEAAEAQADGTEPVTPVDEDEIAGFFQPDGMLQKAFPKFEHRPQQVEMASAVAGTLNDGGHLAVEAGTGVGKSLSYLVPSIYWAQENRERGERVIVSTNTRNLQEQLFYKDLPSLTGALPLDFSAVLLKGRSNYLCKRRWENLTTEYPVRLSNPERLSALALALWADQTRTGDVAEVGAFGGEGSGALWGRLASDGAACRGRRCRFRNYCFHAKIRTAAGRAHVVVVNHALLMSDLAADHAPIGAYNTLVIDEAHHLERSASQHLGLEINEWMLKSWAQRIYESGKIPTGLLTQVLLGLGATTSDHPAIESLTKILEIACTRVDELRRFAVDFFDKFSAAMRSDGGNQNSGYSRKARLRDPGQAIREVFDGEPELPTGITAVAEILQTTVESLEDVPLTALPRAEDWLDDLSGASEELLQFHETLKFFLAPPDEDWVCWAELPSREDFTARLYAAPLNAGDILRDRLFSGLRSAVMTSATLAVANRFNYFLRKIGLSDAENVRTLQLGSPFDLDEQMLIGLPAYLPTPRSSSYEEEITRFAADLLRTIPRGTLGLFTSYRTLRSVSDALEKERPIQSLLVQGRDGSRDQLLRRFRDEPGSILLGTDSFWEGIDVVGEALELLLVAKLPFEVPSEPLVEARLERLKAEGRDPFMYYTVPEAIVRLRQGVGRLIRSKTDRGAALICDSRLASSRYGQAFLESLPVPVQVWQTRDETIQALERFFEKGK